MGDRKRRRVGDAVLQALEQVRAELDDREAQLDQREQALQKAIDGAAHGKKLMAGRTPNDVLALNIGGTRVNVLRKTLCQYDKTMLAAQFSGRWDDKMDKDADGCFFIDQPYELMMALINYLRAKAIAPTSTIPTPDQFMTSDASKTMAGVMTSKRFKQLVEYYGMAQFVYQQRFCLYRSTDSNAVFFKTAASGPEPSIECGTFSTFTVEPAEGNSHRNEYRLKSFDVAVQGNVERLMIGWITNDKFCSGVNGKGVGEEGTSIALDYGRGGVFFNGDLKQAVSGLALSAGHVVTCEQNQSHFRWLVDGAQVASVSHEKDSLCISEVKEGKGSYSTQCTHKYRMGYGNVTGAVSGMGQWCLKQFEYMS